MTGAVALKSPTDRTLAQLYQDVWTNNSYRKFSPGERHITLMLDALKPHIGDSFIDFGCGTGRAAKELQKRGYGVLGIDFANNAADTNIPFLVADLTDLPEVSAQFGYCTDVMEHIETERVDDVLRGIARCIRHGVFFSIATVDDNFGPALVGEQLHLTIEKGAWWSDKLRKHWPQIDIIEENEVGVWIVCRRDKPPPPGFHQHREGLVNTACNTPMEDVLANVKVNAKRDIKWLAKCEEHERHAVIVGGGPSLAASLDEIRWRVSQDQDIFALNGAAAYLVEQGITPDYLLMIDPRADNVRFVLSHCARSYLLASQCHPSVFDVVEGEGREVMMFHLMVPDLMETLALPKGTKVNIIMGMVSSGLVAMSTVMSAGYRKMHLYGYDSSDAEGVAHAYPQDQNTAESKRLTTWFDGKSYTSSYAMFTQAEQFESFAHMLADHGAIITVHGSGLLPDIAREMANQQGEGNGLRPE